MPSLMRMIAEMGLNIGPFKSGLKAAEQSAGAAAQSIGRRFAGLAATYFGFRAIQSQLTGVFREANRIKDLAEQFSASTDDVQKWGQAFESVGLNMEDAGRAFQKMMEARQRAMSGDQGAIDAFNLFGVGGAAGGKEDPSVLFSKIGAAMRGIKMDENTVTALREVFGKTGPRMAQALRELGTDRGSFIAQKDIDALEEAEEAIKRLKREWFAFLAGPVGVAGEGGAQMAAEIRDKLKGSDPASLGHYLRMINEFWLSLNPFQGTEARGLDTAPLPMQQTKKQLEEALALRKRINDMGKGDGDKFLDFILGVPPEEPQQMVNPKRALELGKLQAEVETKLSSIAFGKLDKQGQLSRLLKDQKNIEEQIAYQKRQQVDQLFTEEIRKENIARLTLQQLEFEEKILALHKSGGGIGFDGFRKILHAGAPNPASYGITVPKQKEQSTELVKFSREQLATLKVIERAFTAGRIILGGRG